MASAVASLSRTDAMVNCPAMDGRLWMPTTSDAGAGGVDPTGVPPAMSEPQDAASESSNTTLLAAVPIRIELMEELVAALGLVVLADLVRHRPEAVEGPQEPAVGGVAPAHVPAPP